MAAKEAGRVRKPMAISMPPTNSVSDKQQRPEGAGIEAQPLDHARRTERVADLAGAVRHQRKSGDDAQQRLRTFAERCVEASKRRDDEAAVEIPGRDVGHSCLLLLLRAIARPPITVKSRNLESFP